MAQKKKTNENLIIAGIAAAAIALVAFVGRKKQASGIIDEMPGDSSPIPAVLDRNLVLKQGVRGNEVKELQRLLGVAQDGIFGPITENALMQLKGVRQITLATFATTLTLNQNALPVGTQVMAGRGGAVLNRAEKAANGYYYDSGSVWTTVDFGKKIGDIKGVSATKANYVINYTGGLGNIMVWVKSSQVQKI